LTIEIRGRNVQKHVDDPVRELARYMISEHFAAYFFLRLSHQAKEPVLRQITGFIAKDEFRHTNLRNDLLAPRVRGNEDVRAVCWRLARTSSTWGRVVTRVRFHQERSPGHLDARQEDAPANRDFDFRIQSKGIFMPPTDRELWLSEFLP